MAIYDYGVGGNETKLDANEAIKNIPGNRSLIVGKLTADDPFTPEIVQGLKSVKDVFQHFQPSAEVQFENAEGTVVNEEFAFRHVGDFDAKNLIQNSDFLQRLNVEKDQYNKVVRQLKSNKVLKKVLETPEMRAALIQLLKETAHDLDQ